MMRDGKDRLLRALLNCGMDDLSMLDDVKYSWNQILDGETVGSIFQERRMKLNAFNDIMRAAVGYGIYRIGLAVSDRICELEAIPNERELDEDEETELTALRTLNPSKDIESYHNYLDTHVWCEQNAEKYLKYMGEAIEDFADGTGLEISFN